MVITNNKFTSSAKNEAKKVGVKLIDSVNPHGNLNYFDFENELETITHPKSNIHYFDYVLNIILTIFFSFIILCIGITFKKRILKILFIAISLYMIIELRKPIREIKRLHIDRNIIILGKAISNSIYKQFHLKIKLNNYFIDDNIYIEYYYVCKFPNIHEYISEIIDFLNGSIYGNVSVYEVNKKAIKIIVDHSKSSNL